MADFILSGRVADLILLLVIAEAGGLFLWNRLTGRGPYLRDMAATMLAGAFLVLALRAALMGAGWMWIAAPLAASFLAHGADLLRRR